ncbi:MAG TPA: methyltransferase domain-containing protein [Sphingobium sp.]|uniref:class I SAM-dependent methyltransferase n=1 Tax=Sphingobium sp. TaxID=1912891 RepID=UPI002ED252A8
MTPEQEVAIRQIVRETFYAGATDEYMASESGQGELREHVVSRSATARNNVIPWLSRITDLAGKRVVEFGSGTGAIASVFAQHGAHVHGYEIEAPSVEAARGRARVLGLDHCHFSHVDPEILPASVQAEWEGRADIALFFAVLEHTTHEEAINLIRSAWACLKPGGLLVVTDTPNRLSYCDHHTSQMPFYNNMGDEMIAAEAWRSPRDGFRQVFAGQPIDDAQRINLVRWGRGVSYHAFESAIGWDMHNYVALPGYEKEITDAWPVILEDTILMTYFKAKPVHAHDAFARSALNFVLRKPE